jgi:hypothetical protein
LRHRFVTIEALAVIAPRRRVSSLRATENVRAHMSGLNRAPIGPGGHPSALAAAGARPEQVAKITIFVAGYRREDLPAIEEGRFALFGDHRPADTLVGVAALSDPGYLIEVDAVAVLEG